MRVLYSTATSALISSHADLNPVNGNIQCPGPVIKGKMCLKKGFRKSFNYDAIDEPFGVPQSEQFLK